MKKDSARGLSGVLLLDKPAGPTSFGVIRRVRRAAGTKKVGHTGTLDPMATGLLVVLLGRATKLAPYLQEGDKVYQGRILMGLSTDTQDVTGKVTGKWSGFRLDADELNRTAADFVGEMEQTPPDYSAVKINGRPAYKMARQGRPVKTRARVIKVHDLKITAVAPPLVSFRTRVSKGVYIRSLAADFGRRLGLGACLDSLRRVSNSFFDLKDALTIEEIEALAERGDLAERLISPDRALSFLPEVEVPDDLSNQVENGRPLSVEYLKNLKLRPGPVRVRAEKKGLLALYEYNPVSKAGDGACLTPLRVLGST